ncbi:MAG: colicin immunity domain-containing protein [Oligoflexales bacterium]
MKEINELGLKCNTLLSDYHHWQNLSDYTKLLEKFLNKQISSTEFETRLYEVRDLNCQKEAKWEDILYIIDNLKLKQFQGLSIIINKLFTDLDVFEADTLLRENYEIDEQELRYFAEETLSKLKTYY